RGGCRLAQVDDGAPDDADAEVLDEFLQFVEKLDRLTFPHVRCLHADEVGALDAVGVLFNCLIEKIGHGNGEANAQSRRRSTEGALGTTARAADSAACGRTETG